MESLLDNTFLFLLFGTFIYGVHKIMFEVKRPTIEPEELVHNYFLLKRKKR